MQAFASSCLSRDPSPDSNALKVPDPEVEQRMLEIGSVFIQASNLHSEKFIAVQARKARAKASGEDCPSILVVDDEQRLADTMTEILNMSGFCAFTAYEGETALKIAEEIQPDILLTDVVMPGMNGVELAIEVRKMRPETVILLFSGQAGTIDLLEDARSAGHSFELLEKPMHPVRLIEHLKRKSSR
jgi:CheY-like chemotaxis protein